MYENTSQYINLELLSKNTLKNIFTKSIMGLAHVWEVQYEQDEKFKTTNVNTNCNCNNLSNIC